MSSSAITTQVAQLKIGSVQNQADSTSVYSAGVWSFKNSTALTSVTITDAGNVGVGVTPSAWGASNSGHLQLQDGVTYGRYGYTRNAYFDGASWRYIGTGLASQYLQAAGMHQWLIAPSGTAGNAITYTEAMRIDSSGNVGIGTASPANRLHVYQNAASNINCRIENASTNAGNLIQFSQVTNGSVAAPLAYIGHGGDNTGNLAIINASNTATTFATNGTERMRIDASGNLLVGTTSSAIVNSRMTVTSGAGTDVVLGNASETSLTNYSTAVAKLYVARGNATLRSINAAGTVNASGADYAEYMTKAGDFSITKGDICGINAEGKLTKAFSEAVTFVVKSTNPSYVGGDTWGADLEAGSEELEAARQLVDRIAFCGQVPVNVLGATPGQWIIPVEDNGGIKGEAVSSPSFEQYQKAVGKVIAVEEDGRARIIVKIA